MFVVKKSDVNNTDFYFKTWKSMGGKKKKKHNISLLKKKKKVCFVLGGGLGGLFSSAQIHKYNHQPLSNFNSIYSAFSVEG